MSLHPNALPIDDVHMHLLTLINGLRLQLDARDETIRELRERIQLQAQDLRELYNEKRLELK